MPKSASNEQLFVIISIGFFRITRLKENGLIAKWLTQYYPKNLCSSNEIELGGNVATLADVYGAIILLGAGLMLAAFCFIMEIVMKRSLQAVKMLANRWRANKRS